MMRLRGGGEYEGKHELKNKHKTDKSRKKLFCSRN